MSLRPVLATWLLALIPTFAAARLPAQIADTTRVPVDSVIVTPGADVAVAAGADTTPGVPVTPRGAFIRSLVLPGWGQSEFEAYFRGGVYFAGWAGNWFMNFRNFTRVESARERYGMRRAQLADSLITTSPNPDSMRMVLDTSQVLETVVEADSAGRDLKYLIGARQQQREDWIALTIFWILASGIDAYVTAHLSDFPAAIDLETNGDRSVSVRLEVPLPRRRP